MLCTKYAECFETLYLKHADKITSDLLQLQDIKFKESFEDFFIETNDIAHIEKIGQIINTKIHNLIDRLFESRYQPDFVKLLCILKIYDRYRQFTGHGKMYSKEIFKFNSKLYFFLNQSTKTINEALEFAIKYILFRFTGEHQYVKTVEHQDVKTVEHQDVKISTLDGTIIEFKIEKDPETNIYYGIEITSNCELRKKTHLHRYRLFLDMDFYKDKDIKELYTNNYPVIESGMTHNDILNKIITKLKEKNLPLHLKLEEFPELDVKIIMVSGDNPISFEIEEDADGTYNTDKIRNNRKLADLTKTHKYKLFLHMANYEKNIKKELTAIFYQDNINEEGVILPDPELIDTGTVTQDILNEIIRKLKEKNQKLYLMLVIIPPTIQN